MYSLVLLSSCSSFWKNQNHHISIIIIITIIWILIQTTCSQDTYIMGLRGCFSFYAGYFPENIFKLCLQHDLGEDRQIRASIRACRVRYLVHILSSKLSHQHQILWLFVWNCAQLPAETCCEEQALPSLSQHSWQCKQVCLRKEECCKRNGIKTQ